MRVLLTRPQDDSERTAIAVRAQGHEVVIAPLMTVETVDADISHDYGAVVITSAHAAQALEHHPARERLIGLPLYAVGRRSADAAHAAGFAHVTVAGGDLDDLVRTIGAERPDTKAPLLYLAGENRSGDLIGDLAVHGIAADLAVIYRAVTASYPTMLVEALKNETIDAVLHFSKRSVENYLDGAKNAAIEVPALKPRHICLSQQVAEPLKRAGVGNIAIARKPDEASLIALLG